MNTKVVNLTPHDITIVGDDSRLIIPPSGVVARVSMTREIVGDVNGIPISTVRYGEVHDLPEPCDRDDFGDGTCGAHAYCWPTGTFYIVSALVALACPERGDLLSPGELVRSDGEAEVTLSLGDARNLLAIIDGDGHGNAVGADSLRRQVESGGRRSVGRIVGCRGLTRQGGEVL